jgi:predicted transcriptional regulator
MPATVTLSTRVTEEFRAKIDVLAEALGRDRAWIVEQAVRRYVESESEFINSVMRGREDIKAGRFVDHDKLETDLDRIEAETSKRP